MRLSQEQLGFVSQAPRWQRSDFAVHLASLGWKIFPLRAHGKVPSDPGWQSRATSDEFQIRAWFEERPNMNYGIACGQSGLVVVDLDVKNGENGVGNWMSEVRGLGISPTLTTITPSGGMHLYFAGDGFRNSAGTIAKGVDVRAEGGYVVGPGSITAEGIYLLSHEDGFPEPGDIAPVDQALREVLRSKKRKEEPRAEGVFTAPDIPVSTHVEPLGRAGRLTALAAEIIKVATAEPGTRNATLFKAAAALGQITDSVEISPEDCRRALTRAAVAAGLEPAEIEPTINSGLRAGAEAPRPIETLESGQLFTPLDLKLWFEGSHSPPEHFGRGAVLYREGLTWLSGEPESGKSFMALAWALDTMADGDTVLWLDEEAGPRDTISKLAALGASEALLQDKFLYLQPMGRDLSRTASQFVALAKASNCRLVVIDSAAAVFANARVDEDKNSQVTSLVNQAILPISKDLKITTIVIDHKSKSNVKSRYSRGASAKLGIVDFALNVEASKPFSRGQSGAIKLTVMKDRWGDFGRDTQWTVEVDSPGDTLELNFGSRARVENKEKRSSDDEVQMEGYMQRVVDIMRDAYPEHLSKDAISKMLTGVGSEKSRQAIAAALDSGLVEFSEQKAGGQPLIKLAHLDTELF